MRLFYFDLVQGNRIALFFLMKELGLLAALSLATRLQMRLFINNPFKEINKESRADKNAKLSQRQMAPLIVAYKILLEDGYSNEDAIDLLSRLSRHVAVAFLNFNIPKLEKRKWKNKSMQKKESYLEKIASRFFNASVQSSLKSDDTFEFNVQSCHFARYAKLLELPELAPIFCAADKYYFENHQQEINYGRTQTLVEGASYCDFSFRWKNED